MSDGPAIPSSLGARRAMPLDDYLRQASDIPLDQLTGQLDDLAEKARADRQQVTALARKLLDPELRPLVEWLCDLTLRRPLWLPGLGPEALAYVAAREGQNSIVWRLLHAAAEGRSETIEPRDGAFAI